MEIWSRDSLRASVELATGGRNTVLYDAHGNPHVMVIIPRFRYEDLGLDAELGTGWCTAFLADSGEITELFVGKYQAAFAAYNPPFATPSVPYRLATLPGMSPAVVTPADARDSVAELGYGWHLLNVHEWAAIALWSSVNSTVPRGNTTPPGEAHERGREAQVGYVRTGTGPDTWRHNHAADGIADLVGNGGQWLEGISIVDGRIHVTVDNAFWDQATLTAQAAYYDSLAGALTLDDALTTSGVPSKANWQDIVKATGYVDNPLLARLCIEPAGVGPAGVAEVRTNAGARLVRRGVIEFGDYYATDTVDTLSSPFRLAFVG
jgi:hypothetical protein